MMDQDKTNQQLIDELDELRQQVAALQAAAAAHRQAEEALQKCRDESELKVQERTAKLQEANQQLQAEIEERRRTQATLDAFFDASTAILNVFDDEFRYIKCDPLTASYFNLDSKSIIGRSLKDELAPQFVEEFGPMIRRVVETGEAVSNVEVKSPVPSRREKSFTGGPRISLLLCPRANEGMASSALRSTTSNRLKRRFAKVTTNFANLRWHVRRTADRGCQNQAVRQGELVDLQHARLLGG